MGKKSDFTEEEREFLDQCNDEFKLVQNKQERGRLIRAKFRRQFPNNEMDDGKITSRARAQLHLKQHRKVVKQAQEALQKNNEAQGAPQANDELFEVEMVVAETLVLQGQHVNEAELEEKEATADFELSNEMEKQAANELEKLRRMEIDANKAALQLSKDFEKATDECNQTRDEYKKLLEEKKQIESQRVQIEHEIKMKKKAKEDDLTIEKRRLDKANEECDTVKKNLNELNKVAANEDAELKKLRKQNDGLRQEVIGLLKKKFEERELNELEQLENAIRHLQADIVESSDPLQAEDNQLQNEINDLIKSKEEIGTLKKKNDDMEKELAHLNAQKNQLATSTRSEQYAVEKVQKQGESLSKLMLKKRRFEIQINGLTDLLEQKKQTIHNQELELVQEERQFNDLSARWRSLQSNNDPTMETGRVRDMFTDLDTRSSALLCDVGYQQFGVSDLALKLKVLFPFVQAAHFVITDSNRNMDMDQWNADVESYRYFRITICHEEDGFQMTLGKTGSYSGISPEEFYDIHNKLVSCLLDLETVWSKSPQAVERCLDRTKVDDYVKILSEEKTIAKNHFDRTR